MLITARLLSHSRIPSYVWNTGLQARVADPDFVGSEFFLSDPDPFFLEGRNRILDNSNRICHSADRIERILLVRIRIFLNGWVPFYPRGRIRVHSIWIRNPARSCRLYQVPIDLSRHYVMIAVRRENRKKMRKSTRRIYICVPP